jgi:7-carboxy-7-deazaguanine synthase
VALTAQSADNNCTLSETLVINEVYLSLQGESTFAGLPCIFIRLTACNLRCSYCDTAYAFTEGKRRALSEILSEVNRLAEPYRCQSRASETRWPTVELTGGEPLLQPASQALMRELCDLGYTVLLETSGAHDISIVDPRVRRIMDIKCPSSGEAARTRWENIPHLRSTDEVKFVIGTVEDYEYTKTTIARHRLQERCVLLCSWVQPLSAEQLDKSLKPVPPDHTPLSRQELVERIIADALPVRFQLQMHKVIWPVQQRGV